MRCLRTVVMIGLIIFGPAVAATSASCGSFAFLADVSGGEAPHDLIETAYTQLLEELGRHLGPEELRQVSDDADPFDFPRRDPKTDALRKSLKEFRRMLDRPDWDGADIRKRLFNARHNLAIRRALAGETIGAAVVRERQEASVTFHKRKPAFALSPDGNRLVVLDAKRTLRERTERPEFTLMDLQTHQSNTYGAPSFRNDLGYYGTVTFSEDGKSIALLTDNTRIVTIPVNGIKADLSSVKTKAMGTVMRNAGKWWDQLNPSRYAFTDDIISAGWVQHHFMTTRMDKLTGARKGIQLPDWEVLSKGDRQDMGEIPGTNGFFVRLKRHGMDGGIVRMLPSSRDLRKGEVKEIATWTTLEQPVSLGWTADTTLLTLHRNAVWKWTVPSGENVVTFPEAGLNGEAWTWLAGTVTGEGAAVLVAKPQGKRFVYFADLATKEVFGPSFVSNETNDIHLANQGKSLITEERHRLRVTPIELIKSRAAPK